MALDLMMANHHQHPPPHQHSNRSFVISSKMEDETAVHEAASAGLQSIQKLIRLLSQQQPPQQTQQYQQSSTSRSSPSPMMVVTVEEENCRIVADVAVSRFRKVISLLNNRTRIGHARFRRAPPSNQTEEEHEDFASNNKVYSPTPIQQFLPPIPVPIPNHRHLQSKEIERKDSVKMIRFGYSPAMSGQTSFVSSLTGDGDCIKQPTSPGSTEAFQISNLSQISSAGRSPFVSGPVKRKCISPETGVSGQCSESSGRCHCSKRKKQRVKREVRVPAISMKMADIPPDDFSWRKYGQKPIKGSPYPRGYYKCSSVRGCPARKHVERAVDDPAMLIVTYEGEHNHQSLSVTETAGLILESS